MFPRIEKGLVAGIVIVVLGAAPAEAALLGLGGDQGGLLGTVVGLPGSLLGTTGSASVVVEPPQAEPGDALRIRFTVQSDQLVRVSVASGVQCRETDPLGRLEAPCGASSELLDVKLLDHDTRQYDFGYIAPDTLGLHSVLVRLDSLLSLGVPAQESSAVGSFRVVEAAAPLPPVVSPDPDPVPDPAPDPDPDPAPDPDPDPAPDPGDGQGGDESADPDDTGDGGVSNDALRLLIGGVAGSATVVASVLARRRILGGIA